MQATGFIFVGWGGDAEPAAALKCRAGSPEELARILHDVVILDAHGARAPLYRDYFGLMNMSHVQFRVAPATDLANTISMLGCTPGLQALLKTIFDIVGLTGPRQHPCGCLTIGPFFFGPVRKFWRPKQPAPVYFRILREVVTTASAHEAIAAVAGITSFLTAHGVSQAEADALVAVF